MSSGKQIKQTSIVPAPEGVTEGSVVATNLLVHLANLALVLESPAPLVDWALTEVPSLVTCDLGGIVLTRIDAARLSTFAKNGVSSDLISAFHQRTKEEVEKKIPDIPLVWEELPVLQIQQASPQETPPGSTLQSFASIEMVARGETIGYLVVGNAVSNAFPRFRINILSAFAKQLALGLRSLLDKALIQEQARLLDYEKKQIAAIVGGMREGMILLGENDKVLAINTAAEDMVGIDRKRPRFADRFIMEKLIGVGEEVKSVERDIQLEYPQKMTLRISRTPILDSTRKPMGCAILITDITREAEVSQMKTDFVSAVSHELRTPLTSMREALSIMQEGLVGPVTEKQQRCLTVSLEDVDRLSRIVNDLLSLSRIESGKVKMKRTACSLKDLVDHSIVILAPQAKTLGIQVTEQIPPDLPPLFADPDQVIQVLVNYIGNALKYAKTHAVVTSRIIPEEDGGGGEHVQVTVTDDGPGISKADQSKLFQKFSQLDQGLSRKPGGTGLGLVICKEIVTRHHGCVWVESEPNQGASFCFSIPLFTTDSTYLDLIQQEVDRARESQRSLSILRITPSIEAMGTEGGRLLSYLERHCRDGLFRKEDLFLTYQGRCLLVVAPMTHNEMEAAAERVHLSARLKFDHRIVTYPEDTTKSDVLFKMIIGDPNP